MSRASPARRVMSLEQGEVGGGERVGLFGAAEGQGAEDVAQTADGRDGGGVHARGLEQLALLDGDARVGDPLVGVGSRDGRGDAPQGPGQRHRGLGGDGRHRPFEVPAGDRDAVLEVHHLGAPHLVPFADQVDHRPVREAWQHQGHQPAQRLVDGQGGGQLGGRLRQQGEPLQLVERPFAGRGRAGRLGGGLAGVEEDERARVVGTGVVGVMVQATASSVPSPFSNHSPPSWAGRPARKAGRIRHCEVGTVSPRALRCSRSCASAPTSPAAGAAQQPLGGGVDGDDRPAAVHHVGAAPIAVSASPVAPARPAPGPGPSPAVSMSPPRRPPLGDRSRFPLFRVPRRTVVDDRRGRCDPLRSSHVPTCPGYAPRGRGQPHGADRAG